LPPVELRVASYDFAMTTSYPERKVLRLRTWDYAESGAYFVTATTVDRCAMFGEIHEATMNLNGYGIIVEKCWHDLVAHYPHVRLDQFCVMPNHIHGIIWIRGAGRAGLKPAPTSKRPHGLSEIVRAFKTFSARRINESRGTLGTPVWQRNYYERVIRDERELNTIREYIQTNPLRWHMDKENPFRTA
jgi:REP element-mobilizing transposase RayT